MMLLVFALLSAALITVYFGNKKLAYVFIALCFFAATAQFLWEIYSPVDGFKMPWLQAHHANVHLALFLAR